MTFFIALILIVTPETIMQYSNDFLSLMLAFTNGTISPWGSGVNRVNECGSLGNYIFTRRCRYSNLILTISRWFLSSSFHPVLKFLHSLCNFCFWTSFFFNYYNFGDVLQTIGLIGTTGVSLLYQLWRLQVKKTLSHKSVLCKHWHFEVTKK